ncbi:radical SAM protein [Facklamia sp. P12932]|uniref:radical SAM protein n=1 Tax=Facklamia sp. P12932 TaxID=3421947 RepID=UPI003D176CE2
MLRDTINFREPTDEDMEFLKSIYNDKTIKEMSLNVSVEDIGEKEILKTINRVKETENKVLEFTISTHGDCNFRCRYCFEKFKNIKMIEETENSILKFTKELFNNNEIQSFHVSWFGGEPLLGLKIIKNLSKKCKSM